MDPKTYNMVSVPGTGTRFLRGIVDDNHCPPGQQVHTHVQAEWPKWFDEGWVLCPIRDPMLHAIGRMTREHGPPLFEEFELLAGLANERTHFFCVDSPDRIGQRAALAEWLRVPDLAIDWDPSRWFQKEDKTGWRQRYTETGDLPDPTWPSMIGGNTRVLLKRLGYTMDWLNG